MKNHQKSPFSTIALEKYGFPALLAVGLISVTGLRAQTTHIVSGQNSGIQVGVNWHTVAAPSYGVDYQYTWNDVHLYAKDGAEIPNDLGLEISKNEGGGLFTLLSKPLAIPSSGMTLTFDRSINMHPSVAERGTTLPNDLKDKCAYHTLGVTRAIFHQVIDVIDAETGEMLASHLDEYRFEISRREVLNNIDKNSKITLDLAPFADRQIKIRVWVLAGYNGRGPARSTTSSIIPLHTATDHQNLK